MLNQIRIRLFVLQQLSCTIAVGFKIGTFDRLLNNNLNLFAVLRYFQVKYHCVSADIVAEFEQANFNSRPPSWKQDRFLIVP